MDDIQIIDLIKSGDSSQWTYIYNKYYKSYLSYALKITANKEAAEDCVSDSFRIAMEKIYELKDSSKFYYWMLCIVKNECHRYFRQIKHNELYSTDEDYEKKYDDIDDIDYISVPSSWAEDEQVKEQLKQVIEHLDEKKRVVLQLFYYDNMGIEQIAAFLNVPEGTVKSRLNAARKELRAVIEKKEKDGTSFRVIIPIPFLFHHEYPAKINLPIKPKAMTISATKILAGVLATAVVVNIPLVLYKINKQPAEKKTPQTTQAVQTIQPAQTTTVRQEVSINSVPSEDNTLAEDDAESIPIEAGVSIGNMYFKCNPPSIHSSSLLEDFVYDSFDSENNLIGTQTDNAQNENVTSLGGSKKIDILYPSASSESDYFISPSNMTINQNIKYDCFTPYTTKSGKTAVIIKNLACEVMSADDYYADINSRREKYNDVIVPAFDVNELSETNNPFVDEYDCTTLSGARIDRSEIQKYISLSESGGKYVYFRLKDGLSIYFTASGGCVSAFQPYFLEDVEQIAASLEFT